MRVVLTDPFIESFTKAPPDVQRLFGKQLALLLRDSRHPSLRAKRFDNVRMYARVNGGWRFYYRREGDIYYVLDILAHDDRP